MYWRPTCQEMKSLLVKASKGALNPEKAEPLVREIKSKGVEALTEDLLNQEEKVPADKILPNWLVFCGSNRP